MASRLGWGRLLAAAGIVGLPWAVQGQVEPRMDGHRVVNVTVRDFRELRTVMALTDDPWTCQGVGIGTFDVRMSPEQYAAFQTSGITHRVEIEDVQALVEAEFARLRGAQPEGNWYDDYKNLSQINTRIDELAAAHPDLVQQLAVAGQSFEGRNIRYLRISGPGNPGNRPILWFIGGQHAREWVNPMTVMFITEHLVTEYANDPRVRAILDVCEFVIVPVVNPDGYEYTWASPNNRLWRKNRRTPPQGSTCFGVDLNRNWATGYGNNNGSSSNPCSETYRGTAAWSEPEAAAMRDLGLLLGNRVNVFIDFHTYAQKILWPWSWTVEAPPDAVLLNDLSEIMRLAILSVPGGEVYQQGQGSVALYISSGASKDWPYQMWGAPSWTIELRPDTAQEGGFAPPPTIILPTAIEAFEAVLQLSEWVVDQQTPLRLALVNPVPPTVPSATPVVVDVRIENGTGEYQSGSGRLFHRVGTSGPFTESSLVPQGGSVFRGMIPAAPCEETVQFYVAASDTNQGSQTLPSAGAGAPFEFLVLDTAVAFDDEMETGTNGWTGGLPGDTATTGRWGLMDPQQTTNQNQIIQPGDDHTPNGVNCWVTDGRAGSSAGQYDVDNGFTTLLSPVFDLTGADDARVSYWRWYSNSNGTPNAQDDIFRVDITSNGTNWVRAETVGPTGPGTAGGWIYKEFTVAGLVPLTSTVQLRFIAEDIGVASLVEAAIDDFRIVTFGCDGCYADCDAGTGVGVLDIFDFLCFQNRYDAADPYACDCDVTSGPGQCDIFDFLCFQNAYDAGCP